MPDILRASAGEPVVWLLTLTTPLGSVERVTFTNEKLANAQRDFLLHHGVGSVTVERLPLATPELLADKERLDWMERDHNAVAHPVFRSTGHDAAFGVTVKHEEGSGFSPNGKLREAIDAARAARPEVLR